MALQVYRLAQLKHPLHCHQAQLVKLHIYLRDHLVNSDIYRQAQLVKSHISQRHHQTRRHTAVAVHHMEAVPEAVVDMEPTVDMEVAVDIAVEDIAPEVTAVVDIAVAEVHIAVATDVSTS